MDPGYSHQGVGRFAQRVGYRSGTHIQHGHKGYPQSYQTGLPNNNGGIFHRHTRLICNQYRTGFDNPNNNSDSYNIDKGIENRHSAGLWPGFVLQGRWLCQWRIQTEIQGSRQRWPFSRSYQVFAGLMRVKAMYPARRLRQYKGESKRR